MTRCGVVGHCLPLLVIPMPSIPNNQYSILSVFAYHCLSLFYRYILAIILPIIFYSTSVYRIILLHLYRLRFASVLIGPVH